MLPLQDKLFHMVHDYNVDTSAGKRPEVIPAFSISLNVDNELDKPEILSFLSLSPSKYFQKNNIYQYATSAYRLLLISDFPTTEHYFQRGKQLQTPQPVQASSSQSTD
jgi:hypothetical protein